MPPSTPFNISLHCWKTPDVSQFTRNYSKHPELVKFEARVLIDGRLVAYAPKTILLVKPDLIRDLIVHPVSIVPDRGLS